jgi:hypothetical protein
LKPETGDRRADRPILVLQIGRSTGRSAVSPPQNARSAGRSADPGIAKRTIGGPIGRLGTAKRALGGPIGLSWYRKADDRRTDRSSSRRNAPRAGDRPTF